MRTDRNKWPSSQQEGPVTEWAWGQLWTEWQIPVKTLPSLVVGKNGFQILDMKS